MQQVLSQRISFYVIAVAVVMTLLFHLTLAEQIRGFAITLFFLVLIGVTHGLFVLAQITPNRWAYWFLVPVLFSITATSLYASDQAQGLGLVIATVSFMLFAYWSTAPIPRFQMVQHFLPKAFFRETILPFSFSTNPFQWIKAIARWKSIFLGVIFSLPLLFIFASLFASADLFFSKTIQDLFVSFYFFEQMNKFFWDIFIFVFLSFGGWSVWARVTEHRVPKWTEREYVLDHAILHTILLIVNAFFLIFVGFQMVYFFAGHAYIQMHHLVYSEYMREGFDQLLFAAGLVLGGILIIHRLTHFVSRLTRVLCGLLIVQTGIILLSALQRLWLYVETYHLSVQRYWGFMVLIFVSCLLVGYLISLWKQTTFSKQIKTLSLFALWFFSAVLLFNQNNLIARWNLSHWDQGVELDIRYVTQLLPDAASIIQKSMQTQTALWEGISGWECSDFVCFSYQNKQLLFRINSQDTRKFPFIFWTVSDAQALAHLVSD